MGSIDREMGSVLEANSFYFNVRNWTRSIAKGDLVSSIQLLQTKPKRIILHIKWANFMKLTLDITDNN